MNLLLIWLSVSFAVLFAAIFWWIWNNKRKKERWPVADMLLRSPGESLRRKLEEINSSLILAIALVLVQPLWFFGVVLFFTKIHLPINQLATLIIGGGITIAGFAFAVIHLFHVADQMRNYTLGFYGERAVGEEIQSIATRRMLRLPRSSNGTLREYRPRYRCDVRRICCGNEDTPKAKNPAWAKGL